MQRRRNAETSAEMQQALNQDVSNITAEIKGDEVAELPADPFDGLTQEQTVKRLNELDYHGEEIFTLDVSEDGTRTLQCSRGFYHGSFLNEHMSYGGGPLEPFKLAIVAGVNVNSNYQGGESPLHYALSSVSSQFGDPEWVEVCGSRADLSPRYWRAKRTETRNVRPS